jgi:hypothetical protein
MKKEQIETHSDGYGRSSHPAVNVKVRNFPSAYQVAEHFQCSEETAAKALEYAFESAQQNFWESAEELARHYLKQSGLEVYSEGRSGGWLVVHGLPDIESWDAIMVSRWSRFADAVAREVAYLCSEEQVFESIEANQWGKDGAEAYNFIDNADGSPVCIADLKQQATAAGFAAVIRK